MGTEHKLFHVLEIIPKSRANICVKKPSHNTLNYLHFALVSMETENLG